MHDTDPCEWHIRALHQVLSLPGCKSTFNRPETAFTLDVLDYYGIDAMECKTSAQSFFQKLLIRRVTNNAFPEDVPVSLSFSCK